LEGSTADQNLTYFDRLIDEFRSSLAQGRHVIISSHPDLEQSLLIDLLNREDMSAVWFASVDEVVSRCQAVLGSGAVNSVLQASGEDSLCSTHDIADLVVEVHYPGDSAAVEHILQLKAGWPRAIPRRPQQIERTRIA
jgi:hypothetical protein